VYQHATRDRDAVIAVALAELITAESAATTVLRTSVEDAK
jgi:hypothetical protein